MGMESKSDTVRGICNIATWNDVEDLNIVIHIHSQREKEQAMKLALRIASLMDSEPEEHEGETAKWIQINGTDDVYVNIFHD